MEHKVILIVANEPIAEKDTEFRNKNEQSSYLTELVTARDNTVYLRLANYIAMGNNISYEKGMQQFIRQSEDHMKANKATEKDIRNC